MALQSFRQVFSGAAIDGSNEWLVTANGGVLPADPAAYTFFYEGGQKMLYGVHYTFNGSRLKLLNGAVAWQQYELIFSTDPAASSQGAASCFENIIGLSQTECECNDPKPVNYNVSKSGLYLDELEGISSMGNFENCQDGGIWKVMAQSVTEATKQYLIDMKALMLANFDLLRKAWAGTIGEVSASQVLSTNRQYSFLRIDCAPVRAGQITIKNIGCMFTGTGTITAYIFDNNNTPIATIPLQTVANQHRLNSVNITLPMLAKYSTRTEYYIVVEVDDFNMPRLNELPCGCGGQKPYFSHEAPMFIQGGWSGVKGWGNWIQVGAGATDVLVFDALNKNIETQASHMNGFTLELEIGCKLDETFCLNDFNFATDPTAMATAMAIRSLAASILAGKMLRSESITRKNMINRDELERDRNQWRVDYAEMVRFNANHPNLGQSDCFTCKNDGPVIMPVLS